MDDFEIEIVPRNNRSIKKSSNTKVVNIKINPEQSKKTSRKKPKNATQQSKKKETKQLSVKTNKVKIKDKINYKINDIDRNNNNDEINRSKRIKDKTSNPKKSNINKKTKENEKTPVVVKVIKSDNDTKSKSLKLSSSKIENKPNPQIERPKQLNRTPEYLLKTRKVSSRKKTPPRRLSPTQPKRRLSPRTIQKLKQNQHKQYMINERIRTLKEKQRLLKNKLMSNNPVEEYFRNKKRAHTSPTKKRLTPPRKVVHINPEYNINSINKPIKKPISSKNTKKELLLKRKKLLEAKKRLLTKKRGISNSNSVSNGSNFNYPIKSPIVQSLEYKRERLKNQRQKELEKISHKKKEILSLNTRKKEMKLLEEIKREELMIKKLQDQQIKLDKLQFLYKQNIKKGYNIKNKIKSQQPISKKNNSSLKIVKSNVNPKVSSPKKNKIYSLDGILLSNINKSDKINKSNKSNKKSCKNEKYKINDLSQIEEFLTDYDEVIWDDENIINNKKGDNFNNLIIENIGDLDDLIEMNINDSNNNDSIQKIKTELENNKILNNTNKISDEMCKIVYSSISDLINLEKLN